ncbi:MAG: GGDEF domain-containing protein [Porcipelethomonas sp.]
MKSIQSRILILILSVIVSGCLLSGLCTIACASHILENGISDNINMICQDETPEHKSIPFNDEKQLMTYDSISKDSEVSVSDSGEEFIAAWVGKIKNALIKINLGVTFFITGAAVFSAVIFGRYYIIKPLKKVTEAAYSDSMTGVGNKAAYDSTAVRINCDIEDGTGDFSLIVIDINNLKTVNDTYGHIAGDDLICCISGCIREVFSCGRIYRIGGDEFTIIFDKTAPLVCCGLIRKFKDRVNRLFLKDHPDIPVSAACGYAIFDKETDRTLADVFARADRSMYRDKQTDKRTRGSGNYIE